MVNLSVTPVQTSNLFNTLTNDANQIEALKQAKQNEALNQLKLRSFPQQLQLQKSLASARLALLKEQANLYPDIQNSLMKTRAHQAELPLSSFGKLLHDQSLATKHYGATSPQAQAYSAAIQKAATVNNGLQVYGPNGELLVSQGGPQQAVGNFFKNPMMGSYRTGAGGTYINPQSGEAISTDTTPMATMDQSAISAVQRVMPQINNIIQKLPQFQSGWKNLLTNAQGLGNRWLGGNFKGPSERASGFASLDTAPEALLKAYGLRPSEHALKLMRKTIEPSPGETPQGYRSRIIDTLNQLNEFQQQSMSHLKSGVPLNKPHQIAPDNAVLAEINRRKKQGSWQ